MRNSDWKQQKKTTQFDWAKYYLTWMTPYLREKLYSIQLNQIDKFFYDGIRFQYGIDIKKDVNLAMQNYKKAAERGNSIAIYKIAELKYENCKNSKEKKTDKMYLQFKSYAYSYPKSMRQQNSIDILQYLSHYFTKEDPSLSKFQKILQKESQIYSSDEINYIRARIYIKFSLQQEKVIQALSILQNLANNLHFQSIFSLSNIYFSEKNKYIKRDLVKAEGYFKICYENKYYRSYYQYGKLLFQLGKYQQSIKIFTEGYENGYYDCLFSVISSRFRNIDLKNFKFLQDLLEILIIDIIAGNLYSIFQFIYIKKLLQKQWPDYQNLYFNKVQKQLIKVIKQFYTLQRHKQIRCKDEIISCYALIVKYGMVTKDLNQKQILIKQAIYETQTKWIKRYCMRFLFEIAYEKCYGNKKLKEKLVPSLVELEILKKTEKELFLKCNQNLSDYENSSFYYIFAKIYERGWGTEKSEQKSFFFLLKAAEWIKTRRINLSFLQYFRAIKAKKKLEMIVNTESVKKFQNWCFEKKKQSPQCQICYQNDKQIIFYPCKHMSCPMCYSQLIKTKRSCHLCRKQILSVNNMNSFNQTNFIKNH